MTVDVFGKYSSRHDRGGHQLWSALSGCAIARSGILLVLLGWGLVIAYAIIVTLTGASLHDAVLVFARLGQTAIATGISIVIVALLVGAARGQAVRDVEGFGSHAEDRRAAPVPRSIEPTPVPAPLRAMPAAAPVEPERKTDVGERSAATVIVARGVVDDRGFLLLADGSIVIETLLGQRRFRLLADAQEFIGGGKFVLHDTVQIALHSAEASKTNVVPAGRLLAVV